MYLIKCKFFIQNLHDSKSFWDTPKAMDLVKPICLGQGTTLVCGISWDEILNTRVIKK